MGVYWLRETASLEWGVCSLNHLTFCCRPWKGISCRCVRVVCRILLSNAMENTTSISSLKGTKNAPHPTFLTSVNIFFITVLLHIFQNRTLILMMPCLIRVPYIYLGHITLYCVLSDICSIFSSLHFSLLTISVRVENMISKFYLREQIFSFLLWLILPILAIFLVLIVLWAERPLRLFGNLGTIFNNQNVSEEKLDHFTN